MKDRLGIKDIWPRVSEQTQRARASGALVPLETSVHILEDRGVPFIVRIAQNLRKKQQASQNDKESGRTKDPFLPPYEQDLFVGEISDTHVALLNKFHVLEGHLLLVTREDAPQTGLLDRSDFEALALALADVDGLAFYNGGRDAGASQPHKHLQVVPLPLAPDRENIPLLPLLTQSMRSFDTVHHNPALPFAHAVTPMPTGWQDNPWGAGEQLCRRYQALWNYLGYELHGTEQPAPYNLLATRDWMWLVPRSREKYEGLGANALAFAGAMMVLDEGDFATLEKQGPMRLLAEVGTPHQESTF